MLTSDVLLLSNCVRIYSISTKKAVSLLLLYFGYSVCLYYYRLHPFSEKAYLFLQILFLFGSYLVIKGKKKILRR